MEKGQQIITQVDHLSSLHSFLSSHSAQNRRSGPIRVDISFRIAVPDRSGLLSPLHPGDVTVKRYDTYPHRPHPTLVM